MANQVLFVSTLANKKAPTIPQKALKTAANMLKIVAANTKHCFMLALEVLQHIFKAHPKKILTTGKMNKAKIVTLTQITTSGLKASDVGHNDDVKAQIDHGITRHKDNTPKISEMKCMQVLFSPK